MEGINQGLFGHQLFFMCPVVFAQTCYNRQTKTKTVFCRAGRLVAFNCHLFLARKACSNGQNPSHSVRHLKAEAERWLGLLRSNDTDKLCLVRPSSEGLFDLLCSTIQSFELLFLPHQTPCLSLTLLPPTNFMPSHSRLVP